MTEQPPYQTYANGVHVDPVTGDVGIGTPKQPELEPVACIGTNGELMWLNKPKAIYSKPQPLYTSPPKREPLTDEQIAELWDEAVKYAPSDIRIKDFARLVEQAHGIKGEA
jgi:hypothetical protein